MHWLRSRYVYVVCAAFAPTSAFAGMSVNAQVASEGRFAIYTGAPNGSELELVAANNDAPQPVGVLASLLPQRATFELPDGHCIYVATWGVQRPQAGLIGEFLFNGMPVFSGDPAWEVYFSPLRLDRSENPPAAPRFADEIVSATRRFQWKKAAKLVGNGAGPVSMIGQINRTAAWMWLPSASAKAAPPAVPVNGLLIFRIAPNDIWPEIELNYLSNVGLGSGVGDPAAGAPGYSTFAGGGRFGGGSSGRDPLGGVFARGPFTPFANFDPPDSYTIPSESPDEGLTSDPIIPLPSDRTPVASSDDDTDFPGTNTTSDSVTRPPPVDPPVPPDDPPPLVPEPATLVLLACGLTLLRRR